MRTTFTFLFAQGKNIPSENTPTSGPPMAPKMAKVSCKTKPIWEAASANAMHRTPYEDAKSVQTWLHCMRKYTVRVRKVKDFKY